MSLTLTESLLESARINFNMADGGLEQYEIGAAVPGRKRFQIDLPETQDGEAALYSIAFNELIRLAYAPEEAAEFLSDEGNLSLVVRSSEASTERIMRALVTDLAFD